MASTPSREQLPVMIDIQGVRKTFSGTQGEVVALDRIDLTIRQGDIYGVIGMSGAGKSTLIRCVNRLESPTEGRILIGGPEGSAPPAPPGGHDLPAVQPAHAVDR